MHVVMLWIIHQCVAAILASQEIHSLAALWYKVGQSCLVFLLAACFINGSREFPYLCKDELCLWNLHDPILSSVVNYHVNKIRNHKYNAGICGWRLFFNVCIKKGWFQDKMSMVLPTFFFQAIIYPVCCMPCFFDVHKHFSFFHSSFVWLMICPVIFLFSSLCIIQVHYSFHPLQLKPHPPFLITELPCGLPICNVCI